MGGNDIMNKAHVLQIIFVMVQVIAFIPLTVEAFGGMNPAIISASAAVIGVGLLGNMICAIIKALQESKKK